MRVAGFQEESIVDGPGIRFTVFFQGCVHDCFNCQNKSTWDLSGGKKYTVDEIIDKYNEYPHSVYVTLSGGDPFVQDLSELLELLKRFSKYTQNIWVYTGYVYEDLYDMLRHFGKEEILKYISVIVDGPYKDEEKDLSLLFRGSGNQRLIDVQKSLKTGITTEWIPEK